MLIEKLLVVISLLTIICPVFSDAVIFQTDFSELPDNWYANSSWAFGPNGAVTNCSWPDTWWDADMLTTNSADGLVYFIPDGTDSIIVTIPYYLHSQVSEGSVDFEILMQASGSTWIEIWSRSLYWEGSITETATINASPDWISGGEWIGIRFTGYGSSEYNLTVDWQIHGLTITAIGDSLALDNSTWGQIKSLSEW